MMHIKSFQRLVSYSYWDLFTTSSHWCFNMLTLIHVIFLSNSLMYLD